MTTFLASRPDYFSTFYSPASWGAVLQQFTEVPKGRVLCLTDEGFATAGKIYVLWQKIKEFFGFTNLTDPVRVGARMIQFLFQGATQQLLSENDSFLNSIKDKMKSGALKVHEKVTSAWECLINSQIKTPKERIESLKNDLTSFYKDHSSSLQPSYWNQFISEKVDCSSSFYFGEAYLALARKQKQKDPEKALENINLAAQLYNSMDLEYTNLLSESHQAVVFNVNAVEKKEEIGKICLLLGERQYQVGNLEEARSFFYGAFNLHVRFSDRQKALCLIAAISTDNFSLAEKFCNDVNHLSVDKDLREDYAKAMEKLGDHYEKKSKLLSSSKDYKPQAYDAYRKAYLVGFFEVTTPTILQKILTLLKDAPYTPSIYSVDDLVNDRSDQREQILKLLSSMNAKDLFDSERIKAIPVITKKLAVLFFNKEHQEELYSWVVKAIEFISPIWEELKKHPTKLSNLLSRVWDPSDSFNKFPEIIAFQKEMGAGLHFLEAELLKIKYGKREVGVRLHYQSAAKLAIKTLVGATLPSFTAESEKIESNSISIDHQVDGYRDLAIQRGAADLFPKEMIDQLQASA